MWSGCTGVEIKSYRVIYDMVDDLRALMEGKLAPTEERTPLGEAEVRAVFGTGSRIVAGCMVTEGAIKKGCLAVVRPPVPPCHLGGVHRNFFLLCPLGPTQPRGPCPNHGWIFCCTLWGRLNPVVHALNHDGSFRSVIQMLCSALPPVGLMVARCSAPDSDRTSI